MRPWCRFIGLLYSGVTPTAHLFNLGRKWAPLLVIQLRLPDSSWKFYRGANRVSSKTECRRAVYGLI